MKLKIFVAMIVAFVLSISVNASQNVNVFVKVIKGNSVLADGQTSASKVKYALDNVSKVNNLQISYTQIEQKNYINSACGFKNNFRDNGDSWLVYIRRGNDIISVDDFLNLDLKQNDLVVLYYGKTDYTSIVSDVSVYEQNSLVNFDIIFKDFDLKKDNRTTINITSPDDSMRILLTDNSGKAYTKLNKIGIYQFHLSPYENHSTPNIVNDSTYFYFYGLQDDFATRAEVVAFLANQFEIKSTDQKKVLKFDDLPSDHKYFAEINSFVSNGLLSGYDDGTIRPDNLINLFELTLLLKRVVPLSEDSTIRPETNNLPNWSKLTISQALNSNLLDNITIDWDRPVSASDIIEIYKNYKSHM